MKTELSNSDSTATVYFLLAAALGIYGSTGKLLFFGIALLFAGAGLLCYKRQRIAGLLVAISGIVFSSVVFSYGIGKDMALRDNAISKASTSVQATGG